MARICVSSLISSECIIWGCAESLEKFPSSLIFIQKHKTRFQYSSLERKKNKTLKICKGKFHKVLTIKVRTLLKKHVTILYLKKAIISSKRQFVEFYSTLVQILLMKRLSHVIGSIKMLTGQLLNF